MLDSKKVFIGSDHAGFQLKEQLKKYLIKLKIDYADLGNEKLESNDDYPDYGKKVAKAVVKNNAWGILICGSGVGMCIAANKVKGARAVNGYSVKIAQKSRQHNDSNILCFGQDYVKLPMAKKILKVWLETLFSGVERHARRVEKMEKM